LAQSQQSEASSTKPKVPAAVSVDKNVQLQKQSQVKSLQIRQEMSDHQHLKHLLQGLNDIRVLLNDIYSREYMLESLRQG
jgi:hypothetical protein